MEGPFDFFCRSSGCHFRVPFVYQGQKLSNTQACKLLTDKHTELLPGFVTKDGRRISARLRLAEGGKLELEVPPRDGFGAPPPANSARGPSAASAGPAPKPTRPRTDCKPLMEAATARMFRHNVFRITGLTVDATAREVARQGEKLKQMEELGINTGTRTTAFALQPPPTLDDVRNALQRIRDPESRLVDELFWFWPTEIGRSASDAALAALQAGDSNTALRIWQAQEANTADGTVAMHNVAVLWQVTALEWEERTSQTTLDGEWLDKAEGFWKPAVSRWRILTDDDSLWDKFAERVRKLDDARVATGFALRMREALPEALGKINAELALHYAQARKPEAARFHLQLLRETTPDPTRAEAAKESALNSVKTRLREQARQIGQRAQADPVHADEAVRGLLAQAAPFLDVFNVFWGENPHPQKEILDEVAAACQTCLIAFYRKTANHSATADLLERVLPLTDAPDLRKKIEENLRALKQNLNQAVLAQDLLRNGVEGERKAGG